MKLYAQHGYGPGEKLTTGLSQNLIDGVVLGAKDTSSAQLGNVIEGLLKANSNAEIFFDSHYYASILPRNQGHRLGNLGGYDYWDDIVRNDLFFIEQANIQNDIRRVLEFQNQFSLAAFIAPNILIRHTLNSRDGVTATSFINHTANIARSVNPNRRVLSTLALSREALLDTSELERFVHLITSLTSPPNGFYLVLALAGTSNSELFHADVIANLLYLVSSLKLNGFEVVSGYSDLLGPVFASIGTDAGCSGWFQTLRMFSLNRFDPSAGGGKPPRPLYLCNLLYNRILVSELLPAYAVEPSVRNQFPTDDAYFVDGEVVEPENKTEECSQSWDTLGRLQDAFSQGTRRQRLAGLVNHIQNAKTLYESLRRQGVTFESKSSDGHLQPLLHGIAEFQRTL